jgi:hypothetical protein
VNRQQNIWVMAWAIWLSVLCVSRAQAEVYRWVDAQGKAHYSDKKPAASAQEISATLKPRNIDQSQAEQAKMRALMRPENDADRQFKRQQQQEQAAQQQNQCARMKRALAIISRPVQFIDDKGKPIAVTEASRAQKEQTLRNNLAKHCPQ